MCVRNGWRCYNAQGALRLAEFTKETLEVGMKTKETGQLSI